ncbi:MAG: O-antigen ligase family protein [Granulosicoccaceae bacterium]
MPQVLSRSSDASPFATWMLGLTTVSIMLLASMPFGNYANYLITAGFLGVVAMAATLGGRDIWFSKEWLLLLGWLAYSILPSLLAEDLERAMFKVLTMVQIAILVFAIQQTVVWQRKVPWLLLTFGVSVSMAYLLTFTGFNIGDVTGSAQNGDDVVRVASTLADANAFGAATVMGLALCFICGAFSTGKLLKILAWIVGMVLVVALVNSGSRTAVIGLVILLLGASWAFKIWRGEYFVKLVVGLLFIGVVGGAVFYAVKDMPVVQQRIEALVTGNDSIVVRMTDFIAVVASGLDTKAESSGESIDERLALLTAGVDLLIESHLLGVGHDNFAARVGVFAHSNVMEISVNTGVIGFLMYYGIYLMIAWRAWQLMMQSNGHAVPRTIFVALMAYSVMDITHVSYYAKASWLFLAMITACLEVFARDLARHREGKLIARQRQAKKAQAQEVDVELGDEPVVLSPVRY